MNPDEENDRMTFESGKSFYANQCIIGIAPDLSVSGGYDDGIGHCGEWSQAEREELANYAISLWERFKASTVEK